MRVENAITQLAHVQALALTDLLSDLLPPLLVLRRRKRLLDPLLEGVYLNGLYLNGLRVGFGQMLLHEFVELGCLLELNGLVASAVLGSGDEILLEIRIGYL